MAERVPGGQAVAPRERPAPEVGREQPGWHPYCCPECRIGDHSLVFRGFAEHGCGVWTCTRCSSWYPQEDGIVDFSPRAVRDALRWQSFQERFGARERLSALVVDPDHSSSRQREFFDGTAAEYEHETAGSNFARAHDAMAIESWVERIPPHLAVVDVGAGAGRCVIPLVKRLAPDAPVLVTDISFEMLRLAAQKLARVAPGRKVHIAVGDSTDLAFVRPGTFDVAIAYGLLHHVADFETVIDGVERILTDKAHLLIDDNNASALRGIFDWMMKRSPLWEAEHENHPVLRLRDLERALRDRGLSVDAVTTVWVPPHLIARLPVRVGRRVLGVTDAICTRIPWVRDQGGLILAEAYRGTAPLLAGSPHRAGVSSAYTDR